MYKERWVTLIMLLIGQLLWAVPSALTGASVGSQSQTITAYLLRISSFKPQILFKENSTRRWSGIPITYDPASRVSPLVAVLKYLSSREINDVKGAALVDTLESPRHGKQCLVWLMNGRIQPETNDEWWFPIDKAPGVQALLDGDKLCPATLKLIKWREDSMKDPFQLFNQKPD